jgi:HME family heavy-metal exporter
VWAAPPPLWLGYQTSVHPETALRTGTVVRLEIQFQAQEQATRLIEGLSLVSLAMMFLGAVLVRSSRGAGRHRHGQHPVGAYRQGGGDVDRWRQPIGGGDGRLFHAYRHRQAQRGILRISHYINLCKFEGVRFGQAMIVHGSLERPTPVALVAAFVLTPRAKRSCTRRRCSSSAGWSV